MPDLNIALPDDLKRFVDGRVAHGGYCDAGEYVLTLIRADEETRARNMLESLLLDGLQGDETPMTDDDWRSIRQEARATRRAGPI